jgi:hypothetical protein
MHNIALCSVIDTEAFACGTMKEFSYVLSSVADQDTVGSRPFCSDTDPDVWDRIRFRILTLINYHISTFFGVCKSHKKLKESLLFNFLVYEYTFKSMFSIRKNSRRNLVENLLRSESRTEFGSGHFQKSDPDQVKNRRDPQQ